MLITTTAAERSLNSITRRVKS